MMHNEEIARSHSDCQAEKVKVVGNVHKFGRTTNDARPLPLFASLTRAPPSILVMKGDGKGGKYGQVIYINSPTMQSQGTSNCIIKTLSNAIKF